MSATATTDISRVAEQRDRAYELIDRFCLERADSDLLWVLAPFLRALYLQLDPGAIDRRLSSGRSALERLGNQAYAAVRPTNGEHVLAGQALVSWAGQTQRWPLEPVVDTARQAGHPVRAVSARIPPGELRRRSRAATALADEFAAAVVAEDLPAPCPPAWLYRHFLGAARYMAFAGALIAAAEPRAIVFSTNHSKMARSLAWAAGERGIASVYFPHHPMLASRRLWDLPAHYAALRGSGERQTYEELGVPSEAVDVVGDPGFSSRGKAPLDPEANVAFALPPVGIEQMRETIELVSTAAGDAVTVTPHPENAGGELAAMCPAAWRIWDGRTLDYLAGEAPPALIQHSSGISLESLLLGVPTIQITLAGWGHNYRVIDPDHVPFVESPAELAAALDDARAIAADDERRAGLVRWAGSWCDAAGEEAAKRGWTLIERATEEGARDELAWDGWTPDELAAGR